MTADRVSYRFWQLWRALGARPLPQDIQQVQSTLSPALQGIFFRMQPGEQAHSIAVFHKLLDKGETHPDLLAAALLHDCGKSRFPLQIWERVWIVLSKAFIPQQARMWAAAGLDEKALRGWRRPFVVVEWHPIWGAEMASQAGATPLVIALIRRHQETLPAGTQNPSQEDQFLIKLQSVDDKS
jgi:hypothetical protein